MRLSELKERVYEAWEALSTYNSALVLVWESNAQWCVARQLTISLAPFGINSITSSTLDALYTGI